MRFIKSFVQTVDCFEVVEIESVLNPGIPRLSVTGLPESLSKKIMLKVQSAIRRQGFEWALDGHLVVSVSPQKVIKSDAELLELPIALSVLKTLSLLQIESEKEIFALGSLTLDGEVLGLSLKEKGLVIKNTALFLGCDEFSNQSSILIKKLSDLNNLIEKANKSDEEKIESSNFKNYGIGAEYLSPNWADLLEVLVHGEHSCLLLMPENSATKNLLKLIHQSLNKIPKDLSKGVRYQNGQRPFVSINSSVTRAQVLGHQGKGFYHHAHGGLAYLENLSALSRPVRDAIRSKVQGGGMALGEKTNSILFARNPLCPCGKAKLGRPRKCGFSLYKCRSVLERLSADDFSIFDMVLSPTESSFELYPHPELDLESLNFRKEKAYATQKKREQLEPNSRLDLFELKKMMSDEAKHCAYIPVVNSLDRTRSVLAVARSCADLEGSTLIEKEHIEKAVLLSYKAAKEVSRAF